MKTLIQSCVSSVCFNYDSTFFVDPLIFGLRFVFVNHDQGGCARYFDKTKNPINALHRKPVNPGKSSG